MANNIKIKVYWEDTLDNYSASKEREIQRYFEKKYKGGANVIFKAIRNVSGAEMEEIQADATDQVSDIEYQRKLIKKYLKDNEIDINWNHLMRLDDNINSKLSAGKEVSSRYKKFFVRKIYLNNFLSYADQEQIMPLESLKGLTVISSRPKNYAGKTTGIVDALLFLFFGRTTKTDTLQDVFNKYTTADKVSVKGELEVDNINYLVERVVTRSLKRNKVDYNVKSSLNFWEILPDGTKKDLKGEERADTDKKITEYIGNYDDFLITVVTTIRNFYSLADTKPTERGKIFTRFVGVELLSDKEVMCKSMYDDWFKNTELKIRTSAEIDDQIIEENTKLKGYTDLINGVTTQLDEEKSKIEVKKKDIEIETLKKHQNVDGELYKINEDDILTDINAKKELIKTKESSIEALKKVLIKPEKVFDVDTYNDLTEQLNEKNNKISELNTKKSIAQSTIDQLKSGEICPTCKRALEGVDNSTHIKTHEAEIVGYDNELVTLTIEQGSLTTQISEHNNIKEAQVAYDKADLIIQRNDLELGSYKTDLSQKEEKLQKYRDNKVFIEENKKFDTKIQQLNSELDQMNNNREGYLLTINGHEKDSELANINVTNLTVTKTIVLKEEALQKIYTTYRTIFGKNGISKMILGSMIPLINSYLNQMMFEAVPFKLEVRLNDKNEVDFWMVDTEKDVEKVLKAGSGYESTICLLALRCVLSKVCSLPKPNIVVFDEVFGQVSDENMPLLGAFFERMKEYFDNIFIITHNPVMLDWADHMVQIKKEKDLSYILTNA